MDSGVLLFSIVIDVLFSCVRSNFFINDSFKYLGGHEFN